MSKQILLQAAFLAAICALVNGQSIEFLSDPTHNGDEGHGASITVSVPNLSGLYKAAKKICINGNWVFYTAPEYGVGSKAGSVTAQRLSGIGLNDCVSGAQIENLIKNTNSIRVLGKAPIQFEIYPLTNYLAEKQSDIITDPNNLPTDGDFSSFPIGSFVINDPKNANIICGEKKSSCICVARGVPLVVDDTAKFPKNNPFGKLRRFQAATTLALQAECKTLPTK